MIKYYKRPFRKALSFSAVFGLLVFIISLILFGKYILLPCLLTGDWATWVASGIVSLFMVALWYSYIGKFFYIILLDDKITVRNHFLPFFRISRDYNDIGSIRFWLPVPGNWSVEAVEIAKRGKKSGGLFYGILMVDPKDYAEQADGAMHNSKPMRTLMCPTGPCKSIYCSHRTGRPSR